MNEEEITIALQTNWGAAFDVRDMLASRVRLKTTERGWLMRTFTITGPASHVLRAKRDVAARLEQIDAEAQVW